MSSKRKSKAQPIYPWTGPGHLFHKGDRWLFVAKDLAIEQHPIGMELAGWNVTAVHGLDDLKKEWHDRELKSTDTAVEAGPDFWNIKNGHVTTIIKGFANLPNGFLVKIATGHQTFDWFGSYGAVGVRSLEQFQCEAKLFKKDVNGFDSRIVIDWWGRMVMVNWFEDKLGHRAHGLVDLTTDLPTLEDFDMFDTRLIIPWINAKSKTLIFRKIFQVEGGGRLVFEVDDQEFLLQGLKTEGFEKDGALDYLRAEITRKYGDNPPAPAPVPETVIEKLETLAEIVKPNRAPVPIPIPVAPPIVRTIQMQAWEITYQGMTKIVVNYDKTLREVLRDSFGYTGPEVKML